MARSGLEEKESDSASYYHKLKCRACLSSSSLLSLAAWLASTRSGRLASHMQECKRYHSFSRVLTCRLASPLSLPRFCSAILRVGERLVSVASRDVGPVEVECKSLLPFFQVHLLTTLSLKPPQEPGRREGRGKREGRGERGERGEGRGGRGERGERGGEEERGEEGGEERE